MAVEDSSDQQPVHQDYADFGRELAAFARDLTVLRIAHGNPSLREIERHAPGSRSLSASAVSEVLNGKRLPGLDFLIALVRALLSHDSEDQRPASRHDPRLEEWRTRWQNLQLLQTTRKRNQSAHRPATAVRSDPADAETPHPNSPNPVAPTAADYPLSPGTDRLPAADVRVHLGVRPADSSLSAAHRRVRIFVAMPGSTMGAEAAWASIPEIRRRLLEPVADRIGEQLERGTELVIEKEKTSAGAIHRSMFAEAVDADVYIADLSGANANVYLELGVRWALRDGVTIPICQDIDDVRFNAASSRVIRYGPMPDELEEAIHQITEAAVSGLRNPRRVDSPVRDSTALVTVPRAEHDALLHELGRLRELQAEDLIYAAVRNTSPARRIELLQEAITHNPASSRAHFELGAALRREGRYKEAERALRISVQLKDDFAPAWREIGVTLSKSGERESEEAAAEAFDRAVALDDQDVETWATLGGLLRRLARRRGPQTFDTALLERSLDCYKTASSLSGNTTYPLMNVARIELLLAGLRGQDPAPAIERFRRLEHLARFAVEDTGHRDPWALFDLADTLLLTGREDAALAELHKAIALIPPTERDAMLTSVIAPLQDFLYVTGLLDSRTARTVHRAIDAYRASMAPNPTDPRPNHT